VRLELIDYLMEQRDFQAARVELLIAAGNAPNNLHMNGLFAEKLRATGDLTDALTYYEKAIADQPHSAAALEGAGMIYYEQGDYVKAHEELERAVAYQSAGKAAPEELTTLARDADRLSELSLSRELGAHERARHLLTAATIAQARLQSCSASSTGAPQMAALEELQIEWRGASVGAKRNALVENAGGQDSLTQLIFDTERETAQVCGKPAGDDALLLRLADQQAASEAAGGTP
jgi:tetratricopeptide (TPR) repeat protein